MCSARFEYEGYAVLTMLFEKTKRIFSDIYTCEVPLARALIAALQLTQFASMLADVILLNQPNDRCDSCPRPQALIAVL